MHLILCLSFWLSVEFWLEVSLLTLLGFSRANLNCQTGLQSVAIGHTCPCKATVPTTVRQQVLLDKFLPFSFNFHICKSNIAPERLGLFGRCPFACFLVIVGYISLREPIIIFRLPITKPSPVHGVWSHMVGYISLALDLSCRFLGAWLDGAMEGWLTGRSSSPIRRRLTHRSTLDRWSRLVGEKIWDIHWRRNFCNNSWLAFMVQTSAIDSIDWQHLTYNIIANTVELSRPIAETLQILHCQFATGR